MNGDIRLHVEGLMLERLIQRAANEGARLRSVQRDGPRALLVETDAEGAALLTSLCERFSLPCRIISRRGRNAMLERLKRRATLLAGGLTFVAALALFFSRIWLIDIRCTADTQPLRASLRAMGVQPGVAKGNVDPALLEAALTAASPDFSYVGVRLQGIRLLVEASPAAPAPELYQLSHGRDLVAKCEGIIESVTVLSGAACVHPGDTVVRGQVLIRGDERISSEESRSIAALGTVTARTWHEGTACAPLTSSEKIRTGRTGLSSSLHLMGLSWPLIRGESYPSQELSTEILPIGGLFLPLEIRRTTTYETRLQPTNVDAAALERQLARLAFAEAGADLTQSHPDGCEITGRWIEYTQAGGVMYAQAIYETQTDIAVTRDALYLQGG